MSAPDRTVDDDTSMARISDVVVELAVADVEQPAQFYRQAAGLRLNRTWHQHGELAWASVRNDHVALFLTQSTAAGARANLARLPHIYLVVPDVESLHSRLVASGFRPGPIETEFYDAREFELVDPDGHRLRFQQRGASYGAA